MPTPPAFTSELHPVIHYRDTETTLRNAEIAAQAGCAGVMLINMDGLDWLLDDAVGQIRSRFPSLSIGVNRLQTGRIESLLRNLEVGADSTWADQCGITSSGPDHLALEIQALSRANPTHRLFGGVAFKYQQREPDAPLAARKALDFGVIPTTSGAATGSAPSLDKIKGMAQALPCKALAVASGIDVGNAAAFVPFVRYFLVSTGISTGFFDFNAGLTRELAAIVQIR